MLNEGEIDQNGKWAGEKNGEGDLPTINTARFRTVRILYVSVVVLTIT